MKGSVKILKKWGRGYLNKSNQMVSDNPITRHMPTLDHINPMTQRPCRYSAACFTKRRPLTAFVLLKGKFHCFPYLAPNSLSFLL